MRTTRALDYIYMVRLGRMQPSIQRYLLSDMNECLFYHFYFANLYKFRFCSVPIFFMHSALVTAAVASPRAHVAPRISMEYEGYVEHKNELIIIIAPCVWVCVCDARRIILLAVAPHLLFSHSVCECCPQNGMRWTLNNSQHMKESHEKIMNASSIHFIARVYFNRTRMRMHNRNDRSRE